ncbi:MAG: hypothetical protein A2Y97_03870 [Nitrospirae bacterium RBG_13_39_12]|nr:MAG: hypothetical protein A2Y97_03870 [Nitrospirae bacterium RBG_13_39_12]
MHLSSASRRGDAEEKAMSAFFGLIVIISIIKQDKLGARKFSDFFKEQSLLVPYRAICRLQRAILLTNLSSISPEFK